MIVLATLALIAFGALLLDLAFDDALGRKREANSAVEWSRLCRAVDAGRDDFDRYEASVNGAWNNVRSIR